MLQLGFGLKWSCPAHQSLAICLVQASDEFAQSVICYIIWNWLIPCTLLGLCLSPLLRLIEQPLTLPWGSGSHRFCKGLGFELLQALPDQQWPLLLLPEEYLQMRSCRLQIGPLPVIYLITIFVFFPLKLSEGFQLPSLQFKKLSHHNVNFLPLCRFLLPTVWDDVGFSLCSLSSTSLLAP